MGEHIEEEGDGEHTTFGGAGLVGVLVSESMNRFMWVF